MQNHTLLKFLFATKATEIYGLTLKFEKGKFFRHDAKMRFNNLLTAIEAWNKLSERLLGQKAEEEEQINGLLVEMVDRIIDLPPNQKEHFIDYMNNWQPPEPQ